MHVKFPMQKVYIPQKSVYQEGKLKVKKIIQVLSNKTKLKKKKKNVNLTC